MVQVHVRYTMLLLAEQGINRPKVYLSTLDRYQSIPLYLSRTIIFPRVTRNCSAYFPTIPMTLSWTFSRGNLPCSVNW